MKYFLTTLIGCLLGIGIGYFIFTPPMYSTAEEHFDEVHKIIWDGSYRLNPQDRTAGLTSTIRKLEFHLHRLEEMGEVDGVDLVLPDVTYNREVHDFIRNYDLPGAGVVALSFNPEYVAFPLAKDPPLHLNLSYYSNHTDDIRRFLQDVHQEFGNGGPLFTGQ